MKCGDNMNNNIYSNWNGYDYKYQKKRVTSRLLLRGTGAGAAMIGYVLMQYVFIIAADLIAMVVLPAEQYEQFLDGFASNGLILVLSPIFCILPPFLIYALCTRTKITVSYKKPAQSIDVCIALFFIGIMVNIIANNIAAYIQTFFNMFGINATAPEFTLTDDPIGILLFIIGLAIMPAIVEEFACRVVMLNSMRRYGDWTAIICSAAIFGLMHGNLIQIPFAFICGLIYAYITIKTGSVWISMALHFTNNIISTFLYFIIDRLGEMPAVILQYGYNTVCMVLGVAALIYLVVGKHFSFKLSPSPQLPISKGRTLAAFLLSPGMIIAELVFIIMAIISVFTV